MTATEMNDVTTDVASKWFFPEPGSAEAEALLSDTDPLMAPDLIVAEVCNVAWKRLRSGEITEAHATRAMAQIGRMVDVLSPLGELAPRAIEIARALIRRVGRTPWARHVRPLVARARRK